MGLRDHEASLRQDPPDRADGRALATTLPEVERDRRGAGFMAVFVQVFSELDDLVFDGLGVLFGHRWGRRDDGSNPVSPSAKYR